jgi:hypothetical protein
MTTIPDNPVTVVDLMVWFKMQEDLRKLKAAEHLLRTKLFKGYFPTPKEGTNTLDLDPLLIAANLPSGGHVLKATHPIERKVDEAALTTLTPTFREKGIKVDDLIKRKPELAVKEYRTLTEEQVQLFDQCLIVKPGSPTLEIVLPAAAKEK